MESLKTISGIAFLFALILGCGGTNGLQLKARVEGQNVIVTWNPGALVARQAASGKLTILDQRTRVERWLNNADLRSGKIVYGPVTGDVSFQIDIHPRRGNGSTEWLKVVAAASQPEFQADRSKEQLPTRAPGFPLPPKPVRNLKAPPTAAVWHPPPPR